MELLLHSKTNLLTYQRGKINFFVVVLGRDIINSFNSCRFVQFSTDIGR